MNASTFVIGHHLALTIASGLLCDLDKPLMPGL